MKLKLEEKSRAKILNVLEEVTAKDAAVLQAGVARLMSADAHFFVLDFTQIANPDPVVLKKLATDLKSIATTKAALLFVVSTLEGVGDLKNQAEALKNLSSPENLLALEAQLKAHLDILKKNKEEFGKKIEGSKHDGGDPKTLKKEHSDLQDRIKFTEQRIQEQLKDRKGEPAAGESFADRMTELKQILTSVLQDQKLIKGK